MSTEQWYYRLNGRPHGPFSSVQFEKLIRGKTVTLATPVSKDGKTWQRLGEFLDGSPPDDTPTDWPAEMDDAQTLVPGQVRVPTDSNPECKKPE